MPSNSPPSLNSPEASVLHALLMDAPALICLLRGPDHVYELVNPMYHRLVGGRDLLGKSVREALPEVAGQGYFEILDQVYATGERHVGNEELVTLDRRGDGTVSEGYFNFVYQPVRESDGAVSAVMVFGFEVTEQVMVTRRATELAETLRRANREKDEFIAIISHELRTPMTSILGWSRLLRVGDLDETTYGEALDAIERSTKAQAKLIEDLLDESRIASGKIRLDKAPVDLASLLEGAVAMVKPAAESKDIDILMDIGFEHFDATADPLRLQQVISNVLSNAVKFTPERGTILARLRRAGDIATLEVRDSGRGIAPELLPHIFERFRQGDSLTERQSGLGLGLPIARHLIEMHGGTIEAHSDGVGRGAVFTIQLPLAATEAAQFVERDAARRIAAFPTLDGIRVLVVEDEADNRRMISAVLQRCAAVVQCTSTAARAFGLIDQWKPHVIVSDVALPDMDGCAFLTQVRAGAPPGSDTPALALTVLGRPEDQERILAAGFQVWRQKPIEPADLANDVARLAGRPVPVPEAELNVP